MFFHQSYNSQGNYVYNSRIYRNTHWFAHFHKSYEVVYLMSGQLDVTIDGRSCVLQPGQFAMCLSNQVHSHSPGKDAHFWVGVFSGDFVPEFEAAVRGKIGTDCRFTCESTVQAFLEKYVLLNQKTNGHNHHHVTAGLNLLCDAYLNAVTLVERDNSAYSLMNDICDYIFSNYRDHITLKDVAKALGYDYYYFSRLFRRIFGIRFVDCLNACRCSAAVEALRSTDTSIAQIALDSGFQSVRTFNDVFMKHTGMTPHQYRKRHK